MKLKVILTSGILFFVLFSQVSVWANDYTLGPGDIIEISVWRDESLSRTLIVPPDGIISFPLIDDIDTHGKTVADIRKIATQKLTEYVRDAVVSVMLTEVNSLNAYVIGKVNKPGVFQIFMDTDVMQILSMAGGLNPFASERNIHILRKVNGSTQEIPFDYKEVLKGENLKQNIILQRGDVIVVP